MPDNISLETKTENNEPQRYSWLAQYVAPENGGNPENAEILDVSDILAQNVALHLANPHPEDSLAAERLVLIRAQIIQSLEINANASDAEVATALSKYLLKSKGIESLSRILNGEINRLDVAAFIWKFLILPLQSGRELEIGLEPEETSQLKLAFDRVRQAMMSRDFLTNSLSYSSVSNDYEDLSSLKLELSQQENASLLEKLNQIELKPELQRDSEIKSLSTLRSQLQLISPPLAASPNQVNQALALIGPKLTAITGASQGEKFFNYVLSVAPTLRSIEELNAVLNDLLEPGDRTSENIVVLQYGLLNILQGKNGDQLKEQEVMQRIGLLNQAIDQLNFKNLPQFDDVARRSAHELLEMRLDQSSVQLTETGLEGKFEQYLVLMLGAIPFDPNQIIADLVPNQTELSNNKVSRNVYLTILSYFITTVSPDAVTLTVPEVAPGTEATIKRALYIEGSEFPASDFLVGLDKFQDGEQRDLVNSYFQNFNRDLDLLIQKIDPVQDQERWLFGELQAKRPGLMEAEKAYRSRKKYLQFLSDNMTNEQWQTYGKYVMEINANLDRAIYMYIGKTLQFIKGDEEETARKAFHKLMWGNEEIYQNDLRRPYMLETNPLTTDIDSLKELLKMPSMPQSIKMVFVQLIPELEIALMNQDTVLRQSLDTVQQTLENLNIDISQVTILERQIISALEQVPPEIGLAQTALIKLKSEIARINGSDLGTLINSLTAVESELKSLEPQFPNPHNIIPDEMWAETFKRYQMLISKVNVLKRDLESFVGRESEDYKVRGSNELIDGLEQEVESAKLNTIDSFRTNSIALHRLRMPYINQKLKTKTGQPPQEILIYVEEYLQKVALKDLIMLGEGEQVSGAGMVLIYLQHLDALRESDKGPEQGVIELINKHFTQVPEMASPDSRVSLSAQLDVDTFRVMVVQALFSILQKHNQSAGDKISPFQAELMQRGLGYQILNTQIDDQAISMRPFNSGKYQYEYRPGFFESVRNRIKRKDVKMETTELSFCLSQLGELRYASDNNAAPETWLGVDIPVSEWKLTLPAELVDTLVDRYSARMHALDLILANREGIQAEIVPHVITLEEINELKINLRESLIVATRQIGPKYGLNLLTPTMLGILARDKSDSDFEFSLEKAEEIVRIIDSDGPVEVLENGAVQYYEFKTDQTNEDLVKAKKQLRKLLVLYPAVYTQATIIKDREQNKARAIGLKDEEIDFKAGRVSYEYRTELDKLDKLANNGNIDLMEMSTILTKIKNTGQNNLSNQISGPDIVRDIYQSNLDKIDGVLKKENGGIILNLGSNGDWISALSAEQDVEAVYLAARNRLLTKKPQLEELEQLTARRLNLEVALEQRITQGLDRIPDPTKSIVVVYLRAAYPQLDFLYKLNVVVGDPFAESKFNNIAEVQRVIGTYEQINQTIANLGTTTGIVISSDALKTMQQRLEEDTQRFIVAGLAELIPAGEVRIPGTRQLLQLRQEYSQLISQPFANKQMTGDDLESEVMQSVMIYLDSEVLSAEKLPDPAQRVRIKRFLTLHHLGDRESKPHIAMWAADKMFEADFYLRNPEEMIDGSEETQRRRLSFYKLMDLNSPAEGDDLLAKERQVLITAMENLNRAIRQIDSKLAGNDSENLQSIMSNVAVQVTTLAEQIGGDSVSRVLVDNKSVIETLAKVRKGELALTANEQLGLLEKLNNNTQQLIDLISEEIKSRYNSFINIEAPILRTAIGNYQRAQEWFESPGALRSDMDPAIRAKQVLDSWNSLPAYRESLKRAQTLANQVKTPPILEKLTASGPFANQILDANYAGYSQVGEIISFKASQVNNESLVGIPEQNSQLLIGQGLGNDMLRIVTPDGASESISINLLATNSPVPLEVGPYKVYVRAKNNLVKRKLEQVGKGFLAKILPDKEFQVPELEYEVLVFDTRSTVQL